MQTIGANRVFTRRSFSYARFIRNSSWLGLVGSSLNLGDNSLIMLPSGGPRSHKNCVLDLSIKINLVLIKIPSSLCIGRWQ